MNRTQSLVLSAALLLLFTTPLAGQNLLTNPDFDSGLGMTDWSAETGTGNLGTDSGSCLLSGALDVASGLTGGGDQYSLVKSTQCIPVDPGTTPELYLSAMYKTNANVWARLYARFSTDATCNGFAAWSATAFNGTSATWEFIRGTISVPGNALALEVYADFNPQVGGIPAFTGSWDRFYVGVEPQLFLDGFEAEGGSACHWSIVSP